MSLRTVSATAIATFDLYGSGSALLEESCCVLHCLFCADLISEKGHVGHNQCAARAPCHSPRVMNDCIQGHRNGRVHPQNHVSERVADEQNVDAGPIEESRHSGIVCRQHDDPFAPLLHEA